MVGRTLRSRLAMFAGVLATTALACQLVLGLDEPKQGELVDAAVADPCPHAGPPPRREAGTSGPEASYWMVMRAIEFPVLDEAGAARGFDLDNACTCGKDLHDGAPPCASLTGRVCDDRTGIDNTFATTLAPYGAVLDLTAAQNKLGNTGGRGILIFLSSYNGEADDDEVGVTIIPTEGMFSPLGCDGLPRPDASPDLGQNSPPLVPTHDGCDHWKVREELLTTTGGKVGPLTDIVSKGYVSNWHLVAPSKITIVPLAGRLLRANDTILTGRLEPITVAGAQVFRLVDGLTAGRSPMTNFIELIGHTRVGGASGKSDELCTVGNLWPTVKQTLCESLDTMSSPAGDFTGERCNAFSVAWGFTGYPVYLDDAGRTYPADRPEVDCGVITTPEQLCGAGP